MPTPTPEPKDKGALLEEPNVILELESKDFTYLKVDGKWFVTGFSASGKKKFNQYGPDDYVQITLPKTITTKKTTGPGVSCYMDSGANEDDNLGEEYATYPLRDMVTLRSAYLKIVCPTTIRYFYGVRNTYKTLGNYAYKLREIELSKETAVIYDSAFRGLTGITKVTLPDTLKEIGEYAFDGCTNLSFDMVNVGGVKIGARAFNGVTIDTVKAVDELKTGSYVNSPNNGCFYGANIKQIDLEKVVNYIPPYYFAGAYFSPDYQISLNDVTVIDPYAFAGSFDLDIWLTDAIWEVDSTAFLNCQRLHATVKFGSPAYTALRKAGIEFDEFH